MEILNSHEFEQTRNQINRPIGKWKLGRELHEYQDYTKYQFYTVYESGKKIKTSLDDLYDRIECEENDAVDQFLNGK